MMLIRMGVLSSVAMLLVGCGVSTLPDAATTPADQPRKVNEGRGQAKVTLFLPGMNKKLKIL